LAPGPAAAIGQGVVGHHPLDGRDAQGGEVGGGAAQELGAGAGGLVGVYLGVGQPGVVVDRGVHVFVADPWGVTGSEVLVAAAAVHAPAAAVT
jgi:hypothetical protein